MLCFFKTLVPLIVVLCKTIGNAGFSKSGVESALISAKVFIRDSTSNNSEKKTQIKALSRRRVGIIHPANLKAPLSLSPDTCLLLPDHLVGKVLIEGIVDITILIKMIGLEPCSKSGVLIFMSLKSLLKGISARMENNWLLLGKMNGKTQDTGFMILDFKEVKAPVCLTAANIACIQVKLDLILGSAKLHSGAVMALVDILVDVLDSLDRGNRLHIDMAPVLPDKILAMTDNPSIVKVISIL
jgi:hypothetical protein